MDRKATAFFLLVFLFYTLQGQNGFEINWSLPMGQKSQPMGKPGPDFFHYKKEGQLYRMSVEGEVTELPYDSITFEGGPFWAVWKNGLQGIWSDVSGERIPPVYDRVRPVSKEEDCWAFVVQKYGMNALVDAENRLQKHWTKALFTHTTFLTDTLLSYKQFGKTLYFSKSGRDLIAKDIRGRTGPEFQQLDSKNYLFLNEIDGRIVRDTFNGAEPFAFGLAPVARGEQWGYIRENGEWQIEPRFEVARPFDKAGHAVVKSGGKYGLIRRDGSFMLPPQYPFLKAFETSLYEVREGEQIALYDTLGRVVLPPAPYKGFKMAGAGAVGGYFVNNKALVYDLDGQQILDTLRDFQGDGRGGVFMAHIETLQPGGGVKYRYGLANAKGEWVQPPVFNNAFQLSSHFFIYQGYFEKETVDFELEPYPKAGYLLLNREGEPALDRYVSSLPLPGKDPVCIFEIDKRFGLTSTRGMLLEPAYDKIQIFDGTPWVFVWRGEQWGVASWEEQ